MSEKNTDPFEDEGSPATPQSVEGQLPDLSTDDEAEAPKPTVPLVTPKKVFSRNDVVRAVKVFVHLPKLYPGYEPWGFELRLKLSQEAEERRQEYLALAPTEATVKLGEQNLDEICDLLVSTPSGFSDIKDDGKGPGSSFRNYVETADAEAKALLMQIVEGADNLYWASISPREFRREV